MERNQPILSFLIVLLVTIVCHANVNTPVLLWLTVEIGPTKEVVSWTVGNKVKPSATGQMPDKTFQYSHNSLRYSSFKSFSPSIPTLPLSTHHLLFFIPRPFLSLSLSLTLCEGKDLWSGENDKYPTATKITYHSSVLPLHPPQRGCCYVWHTNQQGCQILSKTLLQKHYFFKFIIIRLEFFLAASEFYT